MTGDVPRSSDPNSEADIAWCHDAVQNVSRTFALTVESLEEPMATHICLGYLLCRIPDTIEDAGHIPPDEGAELLRTYAKAIDPDDETGMETFLIQAEPRLPPEDERSDDWHVVAAAPRVYSTFETLPDDVRAAITPPVIELVEGMAMFVDDHAETNGLRIETQAELEEYCHYAAGTVGTLITNLLTREELSAERRDTLYETAEAFGLLLQLVNIAKDVHDDYTQEHNVYLPAAWLSDVGVPQEAVTEAEHRDAVAAVVSRTADFARSFLDEAERYLHAMPLRHGNTLAAWGVPFLLAVGTLRELSESPADALVACDLKVSRQEVYAVVEAMDGADRDALSEFRSVIEREPLHTAAPQRQSD
jgi:farnesyl-diphosphate farnesyltransferase